MNSSTGGPPPGPHYQLQANNADRARGLVVALLVLLGATVAVLSILFLFRQFQSQQTFPEVRRVNLPGSESPKGIENDIEPPGVEEAPEANKPELQETLQELSLALTQKTAMVSQVVVHAEGTAGRADSLGDRNAEGDRIGNPAAEPDPPKELRFDPESLQDYAAMLDSFGAKLVVLEPKANRIHYATNLSHKAPTTRDEAYSPPRDFYFAARGAPLKPLEIELARKAGIMKEGGILLTFWPDKVARQIYQMERDWMEKNGRTPAQVEKTIYRVEKIGHEYKMRIEEQIYTS